MEDDELTNPLLAAEAGERTLGAAGALRLLRELGRDGGAPVDPLYKALALHGAGGFEMRAADVVRALRGYLQGMPALDVAWLVARCPEVDAEATCRALLRGDWAACARSLEAARAEDVPSLRACMLGYCRGALLGRVGLEVRSKAQARKEVVALAHAVRALGGAGCARGASGGNAAGVRADDLHVFLATVCVACEHVRRSRSWRERVVDAVGRGLLRCFGCA